MYSYCHSFISLQICISKTLVNGHVVNVLPNRVRWQFDINNNSIFVEFDKCSLHVLSFSSLSLKPRCSCSVSSSSSLNTWQTDAWLHRCPPTPSLSRRSLSSPNKRRQRKCLCTCKLPYVIDKCKVQTLAYFLLKIDFRKLRSRLCALSRKSSLRRRKTA